MVDRFNAVADRGTLNFEAWFNDRLEPDRSWTVCESEWRFAHRYIPTTRIGERAFHWPLPVLDSRPDVLVSVYSGASYLLGWAVAKIRGTKTAFWCPMTMDSWVKRAWWKTAMKRAIFPCLDGVLCCGEDSRRYAVSCGVQRSKTLLLPHSIDVDHFRCGVAYAHSRRAELSAKLGLRGTVFIYVGRLWWGKGLSTLLQAFAELQHRQSEEVSLLIVGDGPDEANLRQWCDEHGLRNVMFAGFRQKAELPRFYAAADVFVFPTLGDPYGLVVDEAMASSLPVVSTSAAGEIRERITQGVNGFVVPPKDSAALADRMAHLASDPTLRRCMGKESAKRVEARTPENWARAFEEAVRTLLNG